MNKKEVNEIKKRQGWKDSSINRLCGCYVSAEKEIISTFKEPFLSLPEELGFKYCDIFKKALSGTIGKNLLEMPFSAREEREGGKQELLYKLKSCNLKDDDLLMEFYMKIIEGYDYVGNYVILLTYDVYDIPGKTSDGFTMEDASDEVYDYILCSICPVNLDKPGISFNKNEQAFEAKERDWVIDMPTAAFLFPAFNDRSSDVHEALFYVKKANEIPSLLVQELFGRENVLDADAQKEAFQSVVEEVFGLDCNMETVKQIHEKINEIAAMDEAEDKKTLLNKDDIRKIFENAGASEENIDRFDEVFDDTVGKNQELGIANVSDNGKMEVKTPDVVVKINSDRSDLVSTMEINGRPCIVIEASGDVQINGILTKG